MPVRKPLNAPIRAESSSGRASSGIFGKNVGRVSNDIRNTFATASPGGIRGRFHNFPFTPVPKGPGLFLPNDQPLPAFVARNVLALIEKSRKRNGGVIEEGLHDELRRVLRIPTLTKVNPSEITFDELNASRRGRLRPLQELFSPIEELENELNNIVRFAQTNPNVPYRSTYDFHTPTGFKTTTFGRPGPQPGPIGDEFPLEGGGFGIELGFPPAPPRDEPIEPPVHFPPGVPPPRPIPHHFPPVIPQDPGVLSQPAPPFLPPGFGPSGRPGDNGFTGVLSQPAPPFLPPGFGPSGRPGDNGFTGVLSQPAPPFRFLGPVSAKTARERRGGILDLDAASAKIFRQRQGKILDIIGSTSPEFSDNSKTGIFTGGGQGTSPRQFSAPSLGGRASGQIRSLTGF